MKKPDLFVIGQPKSGTTALTCFLDQHPDIFISKPKEPNFFCKDFHVISNAFHNSKTMRYFEFQDLDRYLKIFAAATPNVIAGEASTNYLFSKVAAEEIYAFNPQAKIIALFREPVSFLYSLYHQYKNETEETAPDFQKALEFEESRKSGGNIPPRTRCPDYLFYSERIEYARQIERYLQVFPREQLKVIIFDDFRVDNARTFKEVLSFLGVGTGFRPDFKGVHESRAPKSPWLNRMARTPWIKGIPKKILPTRAYNKIQLNVQSLLMKPEGREPVNQEMKFKLMKEFKHEVIKINELLHKEGLLNPARDLVKTWHYDLV